MKDYLRKLITEQIQRCYVLKKLIPHPIKYAEFEGLAERCGIFIDEYIANFKELLSQLERNPDDINIRLIFREYRRDIRDIEILEHSGIAVLYFHNKETAYLNRVLRRIHEELNVPLNPPSIASFSDKYFYYVPFTNVIFLPLSESEFLLHIPDLFHEIGHYVLSKKDELKLKSIKHQYEKSMTTITQHYAEILRRRLSETAPARLAAITKNIHTQWKESWFEEFFCDIFAAYLLGPAYVWSHLHLTIKKSEDVYQFPLDKFSTHPSDESRLKVMLQCLKKIGFEEEVNKISDVWTTLLVAKNRKPVAEYYEAYPDLLFEEITTLILKGLEESGFNIVSADKLVKTSDTSVVKILNNAWDVYWTDEDGFQKWEKEAISILKKSMILAV